MEIDQDRLYAHEGAPELFIWNSVSSLNNPKPPDVTLDGGSGLGVVRDAVANQVVTNAVLGTAARKALLGADGTLYAVHANDIAICADVLTAPTLKVDLQVPGPMDMVPVESSGGTPPRPCLRPGPPTGCRRVRRRGVPQGLRSAPGRWRRPRTGAGA